jgi:hypothetical protein
MPRRACTVGAIGLAALVAAPAAQAQSTASVRPGKNISVFANTSFVAAFGYQVGSPMQVELVREGHVVARSAGLAGSTPDGGALEVNHGPLGTPQPGDCWTNFSPRVLPGDEVRVTGDGGTDTALVDNIRIAADAHLVGEDVVVEGTAFYANGVAIPPEALNSGEARAVGPVIRATPTKIEAGPDAGDWIATYERVPTTPGVPAYGVDPAKGGGQPLDTKRDQIVKGSHSMGYGHAAPLPALTQLADGVGDAFGPAPGCGVVAPVVPVNAITTLSDDIVNRASGDLTIGGVTNAGTPVSVSLDNAADAAAPVTVDATEAATSDAWSATVTRTELESIADGTLTISASFGANTLSLKKDTVAAAAIHGTPAPGTYTSTQSVSLGTGDGSDVIRFTSNGTDPTAASQRATGPISIASSRTLKAFATDAAGNAGPMQSLTYTIDTQSTGGGQSGGGGSPSSGGQGVVLTVPVSVPAGLTGSTATKSKPYLRSFGTSPRVRRSVASKAGIRVVMGVADDAEVVRLRVLRKLSNGKRLQIASVFRSPSKAGLFRVRLSDAALRGKLRIGDYEVEATPGASRANLGSSSRYGFKVVKG